MSEILVRIKALDLPGDPRSTMARLRGTGRHALLESALVMPGLAEWSYIAGPALATLYTDDAGTRLERDGVVHKRWSDPFDALDAMSGFGSVRVDGADDAPPGLGFAGGWVGMLGYDLVRHLERLPAQALRDPALPAMWWMAVDQVLAFHHPSRRWWQCTVQGSADAWPWSTHGRADMWRETVACAAGPAAQKTHWHASPRHQRTDRRTFERGVQQIRDAIAAGDVLQVNLTRREDAAFEGDAWSLYEDLLAQHPAPFAAFIDGPGFAIASASPERFLQRLGEQVEARPIKGTAARGTNPADDKGRRDWLAASEKDRAENLMIVDLMRNDLGRVARIGSVQVERLFALEPYASVWQMVSTVRAQLRDDVGPAGLLRACWPPGSMTGAPKHKAMQIIEALEPVQRGAYSGSIGYLDCRGNLDLSVVIRSAVVAAGRVMVQLGAGIVADSDPHAEWLETVAKGERLLAVLDGGGSAAQLNAAPSPAARRGPTPPAC
ncbi:MAG TPA: aminodeoxychorismate synthase component I [Albitalea sp.]|nr:aminodeoxychorismate synthase component I [Albitalea sp.]